MQIFLMRHGEAGIARPGTSDGDRTLTATGEADVRRVISQAAGLMGEPVLLTSPYRRAQQTAELARQVLKLQAPALTSGDFTPESSVRDAWAELRLYREAGSVLVVGHEPLFSALAAFLLGFPDVAIEFGTATLVALDVLTFNAQPRGLLRWMLTANLAV